MMELKTFKRRVEVLLRDGVRLEGCFFVAATSPFHDGPQSLAELLNSERRFLPLELDSGEVILLSRNGLSRVSCQAEENQSQNLSGPRLPAEVHFQGGETLQGTVLQDLPEEYPRLSDCLNIGPQFFLLEKAGRHHLVNSEAALWVGTGRERPPFG